MPIKGFEQISSDDLLQLCPDYKDLLDTKKSTCRLALIRLPKSIPLDSLKDLSPVQSNDGRPINNNKLVVTRKCTKSFALVVPDDADGKNVLDKKRHEKVMKLMPVDEYWSVHQVVEPVKADPQAKEAFVRQRKRHRRPSKHQ